VANIKSYLKNLKLLSMTTYVVSRSLLVFPYIHIFSSLLLHSFSSRVVYPTKHTCCTNFKSGYTGAITIPRARHVTKNRNAVCVIELRVGHLHLYHCCFRTIAIRLFFFLLDNDRFSNLFLYRIFSGISIYFYCAS